MLRWIIYEQAQSIPLFLQTMICHAYNDTEAIEETHKEEIQKARNVSEQMR